MSTNIKQTAHRYFDIIWLYKHYHCGKSAQYWRKRAYKWLARKMNMSLKQCHFSKMNEDDVEKAIDICAKEFADSDKLINFAERIDKGEIPEMTWFRKKYISW